jgi:sugar lactone lactonase YvrE
MTRTRLSRLALLCVAVLASCSGGDGDEPAADTGSAAPTVESTVPGAATILGFAVSPDGSWIAADFGTQRVLRIQPSGEVVELAQVSSPVDVEVDADGNVYVSEWKANRVERIDAKTGTVETIAGDGSAEPSGDGGPATEAGVPEPQALALDGNGALYITSWNTVRKVDLNDGTISTVAGNGKIGAGGDGGPATKATLWAPHGVGVASDGDIVIAQWTRFRRVDAETGLISRVAGKGHEESSTGDGGPALDATLMPVHFELDAKDRIYFVDVEGNSVRMIDENGMISTLVDGEKEGVKPYDVALANEGNLLVADYGGTILHVDLATGTVMPALDAS